MSIPAFLSLTPPPPFTGLAPSSSSSSSTSSSPLVSQCPSVRVHPVVIFSILDHFKRRTTLNGSVVGTLLGERTGDSIIVKNAFPVPVTELDDKVLVQQDYHRSMLALQKKVNPKQVVLGWYSTGGAISYISWRIHDFYRQEVVSDAAAASSSSSSVEPILLTLDVSLQNDCLPLRAYTCSTIKSARALASSSSLSSSAANSSSSSLPLSPSLSSVSAPGSSACCARFEPAHCQLIQYDAEKIGVDLLISGVPDDKRLDAPASLQSDHDNLEHSINRLQDSIDTVLNYIHQRLPPIDSSSSSTAAAVSSNNKVDRQHNDIGAAIAEATSFIPSAHSSSLSATATSSSSSSSPSSASIQQSLLPSDSNSPFHAETHDMLMLVYLAQMTSTQINVADKIASLVL